MPEHHHGLHGPRGKGVRGGDTTQLESVLKRSIWLFKLVLKVNRSTDVLLTLLMLFCRIKAQARDWRIARIACRVCISYPF